MDDLDVITRNVADLTTYYVKLWGSYNCHVEKCKYDNHFQKNFRCEREVSCDYDRELSPLHHLMVLCFDSSFVNFLEPKNIENEKYCLSQSFKY